MKNCIVVFAGLLVLTSSLHAQQQKGMIYSFYTGFSKPASPADFQKSWRSGYFLGAGLGKPIASRLQAHLYLDYSNFALDDRNYMQSRELISAETVIEGGMASITALFVDVKLLYPTPRLSKVTPYLVAGGGWFHLYHEEITVFSGAGDSRIAGFSEDAFGAGFGFGFNVFVEGITSLFAEVRFNVGLTEDETTVVLPIKLGFSIH